jgi:HSP20 family protein
MFDPLPWFKRKELGQIKQEVDRVINRFLRELPQPFRERDVDWMPSVDVSETSREVIVKAEVPAMNAEEFDLSLRGNTLHIRGERKQERQEMTESFHRVERGYGRFSRTISLPAALVADKVAATYQNGVLKIILPKAKEEIAKKIEVKNGARPSRPKVQEKS